MNKTKVIVTKNCVVKAVHYFKTDNKEHALQYAKFQYHNHQQYGFRVEGV